MKSLNITIICMALIISVYMFSGGIYRYDTIQLGVIHRINIITGNVSVCIMEEGCKDFVTKAVSLYEKKIKCPDIESAIFPITYYRNNPEYNAYTDSQLANWLYAKYTNDYDLKVSKESFFEVIGSKK